jgi:hypothetical protein
LEEFRHVEFDNIGDVGGGTKTARCGGRTYQDVKVEVNLYINGKYNTYLYESSASLEC